MLFPMFCCGVLIYLSTKLLTKLAVNFRDIFGRAGIDVYTVLQYTTQPPRIILTVVA